MSENSGVCFICKFDAEVHRSTKDEYFVKCGRCGEYTISRSLSNNLGVKGYENKYLVSGVIRNRFEEGYESNLHNGNIDKYYEAANPPKDPLEAIDRLLLYVLKKSDSAQKPVKIRARFDYPLLFAKHKKEFQYYLSKMHELKYLETGPTPEDVRLSLAGWQRVLQIREEKTTSNQGFVAMSFNDDLDDLYENGIKRAISDSGFEPYRIDLDEHSDLIPDKMLSEIRKSKFVVADFTEQKNGVYFEAGFAMGLGLKVIWLCDEDDFPNAHFDTKQFNHIIYSGADDLYERLKLRIQALVT